jgi:hypothetical protein
MVPQGVDHLNADDGDIQRGPQLFVERWSDAVFSEMERAGSVRLNASWRWTLHNQVEFYQILQRQAIERRGSGADDRKSLIP